MKSSFQVKVTKDHLVFAAGHFITIETPGGVICERIHGHNWRLAVEVHGPLDVNQYVFDFIALRDAAQAICEELDHHMLIPTQHPLLPLSISEREVEIRFEDRRWVFPRNECYLLPLEQSTAELLAQWIGERLLKNLESSGSLKMDLWRVDVEENFGQWASWVWHRK